MNVNILETIQPLNQGWGMTFWLLTACALVAGASLWFLLRGKPAQWTNNMRMLVAMLAFFVMLIAGGSAFFQGWTKLKKGPVVFFDEHFQTANGKTMYTDITLIRREPINHNAPFNPNIQIKEADWLLIIQGKDGTVHALPSTDYPINKIADKLKALKANAD